MGQSVTPMLSRVGYAQLPEYGQVIKSPDLLYYPNYVKINRLVVRVIQVFLLQGLHLSSQPWWHAGRSLYSWAQLQSVSCDRGGNLPVWRTPGVGALGSRCDWFSKSPLRDTTNSCRGRRLTKVGGHAVSTLFNAEGLLAARRGGSWAATPDIFYTKVSIFNYKTWTICSWNFFTPPAPTAVPLGQLFQAFSAPTDVEAPQDPSTGTKSLLLPNQQALCARANVAQSRKGALWRLALSLQRSHCSAGSATAEFATL